MDNQNNQYSMNGYNQNQYNQQGMQIGNQQCMTQNRKSVFGLDLVALIVSIISLITCSGCFVLGITGIVISIVVLADNSGKYITKTKAIIGLILSTISMLIMLLAIIVSKNNVPNLAEYEPSEAVERLENMNNNYTISQEYEFSDTVEKGLVTRTTPEYGEKAEEGTTIVIYISRGKAVNVPDLTNIPLEEAIIMINEIGLEVEVHEQNSDVIGNGNVISTEPVAYSDVEEGSKVVIIKSLGASIEMPDIIGLDIEQAREILDSVGIIAGTVIEYSEYPINTVISANYATGDKIDTNSKVVLVVSKGTKEQEIQNFKDSCETPSYDDLIRYPEKYSETPIKLTVKIDKIESETFLGIEYGKAICATYNGETIIIRDDREVQEPALREGDKITIYGYGGGTDTIQTKQKEYQGSLVFGFSYDKTVDEYEVPSVKIHYSTFPPVKLV